MFYNINKKVVLISVIALVIIASVISLYNLRFKYSKDVVLVYELDKIATYLPFTKTYRPLVYITADLERSMNSSKVLSKEVEKTTLTAQTLGDILYNRGVYNGQFREFEIFRSLINKAMFKTRKCSKRGCFAKKYGTIDDSAFELPESDYSFKHPLGATVMVTDVSPACLGKGYEGNNVCATIYIDVNGKKRPNVLGSDLYDVVVVKNAKNRFEIKSKYAPSIAGMFCHESGYGCFYEVLDYPETKMMLRVGHESNRQFSGIREFDNSLYFLAKNGKLILFNIAGRYVEHITKERVREDIYIVTGNSIDYRPSSYAMPSWTERLAYKLFHKFFNN